MIIAYIYDKRNGRFLQEVSGNSKEILEDLKDTLDFTLVRPPDYLHLWIWVDGEWLEDTPDVLSLISLQDTVWSDIKNKRLAQVTSGVLVKSINKKFHTDEISAIQYSNVAGMIALNNYEPIQWKVMDNSWVLLTIELFMDLQKAMNANTQVNYEVAEHHKENMLTMSNPMEYDFSNGWTEGIVDY